MLTPKEIHTKRFFMETCLTNLGSDSAEDASIRFFSGNITDRFGFFYNNHYSPYIKSTTDILNLQGAILVAEGGMGKTYVMDAFASQVPQNSRLKIAVGEYCGNSADLVSELSNIPADIHYIFVDGVDEAPAVIPTLLRKLMAIDRDRIRLFIAMRNIGKLKAFQEKLALPVYSLLPLTQEEVLSIAKHEDVKEDAFIEKVIQEGLAPICAKPQGCKALLTIYKKDGLKNTSGEKLWKQSVLFLCAENDTMTRLISGDDSNCITPQECFNYAAKIALILKLSGRNVVSGIQETIPDDNPQCVSLSNFYASSDAVKINAILSRGIFMPANNGCFKFAHQSYFDYLAAVGLLKLVNRKHWSTILLSSDKASVYPTWEGPASWIAAYDQEWCKTILDIQPELLIVSEYTIDKIGAARLCKAIIMRSDKIVQRKMNDIFLIKRLGKLKSEEIIPILNVALDNFASCDQMEIVIDIIRECQIHELENKLTELFCNSKINYMVRKFAGYALCDYASNESREKCKQLLLEKNNDLGLKGLLFRMTWPNLISMRDIAPHLINKERHIIDAYDFWISQEFPKSLLTITEEQAMDALEWAITDAVESDGYLNVILNMRRQIFTLCWKKYFKLAFMQLLAKGFWTFSKQYLSPFADQSIHDTPQELCYTKEDFRADEEKRHQLAETLIKMQIISERNVYMFPEQLLFDTDVDFVFSMIENNNDTALCKKWCICLSSMHGWISFPQMSQRWNNIQCRFPDIITCDAATIVQERKKRFDEIASLKAKGESRAKERNEKLSNQRCKMLHNIRQVLGTPDAYKFLPQIIAYIMGKDVCSNIDLRQSNIWKEFSPTEIKQLAVTAKVFLTKEKKTTFSRKENIVYPDIPVAFFLVYSELPNGLDNLSPEIWNEFAEFLFDYIEFPDNGMLRPIFEYMSRVMPHIYNSAALETIRRKIAKCETFFSIKYGDLLGVDGCLSIAYFALSNECSDLQRYLILHAIHQINPQIVKDILLKEIQHKSNVTYMGNYLSFLILNIFPDRIHDFIDRLVSAPPAWGKRWVEDIIKVNGHENIVISTLAASEITDLERLYIWLHQNYPASEEPFHSGAFFATPIDDIYIFIGKILNAIKTYPSSTSAIAALQHIYTTFPQDVWLKKMILEVKKTNLEKNTPIYSQNEIKRIIDSQDFGDIINAPEDLLRLILGLLVEYQIYLTGKETPRVDDLWDYSEHKISHRDEGYFSNHLKSFLSQRIRAKNIAINREVLLNNGIDGEPGSQTDIWINAFSHIPNEKLSLCIEVKGSWNQECLTSMDNQLIRKYMGAGGAAAGIFLVGWFQSKTKPVRNVFENNRTAAEDELRQQEKSAAAKGYLVRSVIIDCPAKY